MAENNENILNYSFTEEEVKLLNKLLESEVSGHIIDVATKLEFILSENETVDSVQCDGDSDRYTITVTSKRSLTFNY